MAGADRNATDSKNLKALNYIESFRESGTTSARLDECDQILRDTPGSSFGELMAIRSTYAKQQTNTLCVFIFYFLFMTLTFIALEMNVLTVLRSQEHLLWVGRTVEILFSTSIVLNILVAISDPGYLKSDEKMDFLTLLETLSPYSLCPEC